VVETSAPLEDHEHGELLVRAEAVLGVGRHEGGLSLAQCDLLALHLQDPAPLEDDVDLVVRMGQLTIRLGVRTSTYTPISSPDDSCTISYPPAPASSRSFPAVTSNGCGPESIERA
jgi:hypothetical protein